MEKRGGSLADADDREWHAYTCGDGSRRAVRTRDLVIPHHLVTHCRRHHHPLSLIRRRELISSHHHHHHHHRLGYHHQNHHHRHHRHYQQLSGDDDGTDERPGGGRTTHWRPATAAEDATAGIKDGTDGPSAADPALSPAPASLCARTRRDAATCVATALAAYRRHAAVRAAAAGALALATRHDTAAGDAPVSAAWCGGCGFRRGTPPSLGRRVATIPAGVGGWREVWLTGPQAVTPGPEATERAACGAGRHVDTSREVDEGIRVVDRLAAGAGGRGASGRRAGGRRAGAGGRGAGGVNLSSAVVASWQAELKLPGLPPTHPACGFRGPCTRGPCTRGLRGRCTACAPGRAHTADVLHTASSKLISG